MNGREIGLEERTAGLGLCGGELDSQVRQGLQHLILVELNAMRSIQ
jgi:hypothetical protein